MLELVVVVVEVLVVLLDDVLVDDVVLQELVQDEQGLVVESCWWQLRYCLRKWYC